MSIGVSGIGWFQTVSNKNQVKGLQAEPYGMGKLMYSPLETVFVQTMQREGVTVSVNTTGQKFQTFMRRQNDNANTTDSVLFYYDTESPADQGTIINMGRKKYLLLNKETEENSCYYKSLGVACNGILNTSDNAITNIPVYADDMKDALRQKGDIISVVDGNIEFLTEANAQAHTLKINDTFEMFGRWYKIDNIYYKDGICHIITQVIQAENENNKTVTMEVLGITDGATYSLNGQIQLLTNLYLDGELTNGTVQYSTSNTDIAVVNENGLVTLLKEGETVLYVYWKEKDIGKSFRFSLSGDSAANMILSSSSNTIKVSGSYKAISATIFSGGEDITETITTDNGYSESDFEWTASINGEDVTNESFIKWLKQSNLCQIKVKFGDERKYLMETLIIKCRFVPKNAEATIELKITT